RLRLVTDREYHRRIAGTLYRPAPGRGFTPALSLRPFGAAGGSGRKYRPIGNLRNKESDFAARGLITAPLYQIQPPFRHAGPVTVATDPLDDKGVPVGLKVVLPANLPDDRFNGRVLKFDHLPALLAVQVLVLRVAVVVLVKGPVPHVQTPQQTGVHEFGQRPVDGGPTHAEPGALHVVDQLVRVEVVVLSEDIQNHVALLLGVPLRFRPA